MNLCTVWVGFVASVSFTLSCASPTHLYPGDRRPPDEVGVLKMVTNGKITKIDGRNLEGRRYALLPGDHSLEFRVLVRGLDIHPTIEDYRMTLLCDAKLAVKASHEYRITRTDPKSPLENTGQRQSADERVTNYSFKVFIVDRGPDGEQVVGEEADCSWELREIHVM